MEHSRVSMLLLASVLLISTAVHAQARLPCKLTPEDYEALGHAMKGPLTEKAIEGLSDEDKKGLCWIRALARRIEKAKKDGLSMEKVAGEYKSTDIPRKQSRFLTAEEWKGGVSDVEMTMIANKMTHNE